MTCPLMEYHRETEGRSFDEPRAYCTAADRFVQPMRADVCNDRYDLVHDRDCEIYLAYAGGDESDDGPTEGESDDEMMGGDSDRDVTEGESDNEMMEGESDDEVTEGESDDEVTEVES